MNPNLTQMAQVLKLIVIYSPKYEPSSLLSILNPDPGTHYLICVLGYLDP